LCESTTPPHQKETIEWSNDTKGNTGVMKEWEVILIALLPEIRIANDTEWKEEYKKKSWECLSREEKWIKQVTVEKKQYGYPSKVGYVVTITNMYRE
jgi:hypothetical protein